MDELSESLVLAEDFFRIPRFLVECDLGYRFYLEHHFMNGWETVLYALPVAAC